MQTEIDTQHRTLETIPEFVEEIQNLRSKQLSYEEHLKSLQMDIDVGYAKKLGLELTMQTRYVKKKSYNCTQRRDEMQQIQGNPMIVHEEEIQKGRGSLMIAHKEEMQQIRGELALTI